MKRAVSRIRSSSTHVSVDEQLYIPGSGRPSSSPFAPLLYGQIKQATEHFDHDSSEFDPNYTVRQVGLLF